MKKVYIVWRNNRHGKDLVKIYQNKEDARKFSDMMNDAYTKDSFDNGDGNDEDSYLPYEVKGEEVEQCLL